MKLSNTFAVVALLLVSSGAALGPAAAADDDIEPDVDSVCGAIANVCHQTCISNDPRDEYPALTTLCHQNCDADYRRCIGGSTSPTRRPGGNVGSPPSGGGVLDRGPAQSNNPMFLQDELLTRDR